MIFFQVVACNRSLLLLVLCTPFPIRSVGLVNN